VLGSNCGGPSPAFESRRDQTRDELLNCIFGFNVVHDVENSIN
jgi:hypothetical protein